MGLPFSCKLGHVLLEQVEGACQTTVGLRAEQGEDLGIHGLGHLPEHRQAPAAGGRDGDPRHPAVPWIPAALDESLFLEAVEVANHRRGLDAHALRQLALGELEASRSFVGKAQDNEGGQTASHLREPGVELGTRGLGGHGELAAECGGTRMIHS